MNLPGLEIYALITMFINTSTNSIITNSEREIDSNATDNAIF